MFSLDSVVRVSYWAKGSRWIHSLDFRGWLGGGGVSGAGRGGGVVGVGGVSGVGGVGGKNSGLKEKGYL